MGNENGKAVPAVCWFSDCNKNSVPLVGGKCSSLGEMINAGIRVPPGFAVTTEGYRQFMAEGGLGKEIFAGLDDVDHTDLKALEEVSARIRASIEEREFSPRLEDEICEFYRRLGQTCCVPAVPVAVRSSATAEDLPGASFAGQQDTYLWIRGADDLMRHVRKCFSSLFTARAIAYRNRMDFAHDAVAISVGVQKMANSYAAGVMFTLNPSNGDRSTIVINSNFGFGESVVSGEVTPDEFLVNKISLEAQARTISCKQVYYTVDRENHRSKLFDLPAERQSVQSILDEEVAELAAMGKLIEKHYGRPMDVEWAIDRDMSAGSNVFILQARPETVWSNKKKEPVSGAANKNATQHILGALMAGRKFQ
ncbi:MAG TPA: PEP/pyruvate-binding domain-containing protein [Hyphomicrobiales bacterium]|nr:PEP/pyruvate-binding domain-containing protein [Rhodobiaceae bacterium]HXK53786.1 PEP/pyruvate-binding domain-containing protein [Hyphomicrobiales bacterium]